jgi:hypothetical protein
LVRKIARERTQKYRDTPEAKIKAKAYNALESTRTYKAKFAREWRKDPENAKKMLRASSSVESIRASKLSVQCC